MNECSNVKINDSTRRKNTEQAQLGWEGFHEKASLINMAALLRFVKQHLIKPQDLKSNLFLQMTPN